MSKPKLIRITTVPESLRGLLKGQLGFMAKNGFEVVAVSSPGKALEDVEKNEDVKTIAVEMSRTISPIKDLKALFQLIQVLRKEKPEIVHTHTPKAGLLGMLAARIVGVPHRLHTVAGMPLTVATGVKRKILNFTEKLTYACATQVYPNSYGLQEIILENKFTKKEKLKVIGHGSSNGIDTMKFDPNRITLEKVQEFKSKLGIANDDFVFLFVGRVVTDKGVNELVEAFIKVSKINSKVHLIIVGDYEKSLDPLNKITENTIVTHNKIHFQGIQMEIVKFFAISNALTFPSYREGFPNVVMEAAAMQLNCIVSDINGCNEIITHGENGWIVPTHNVEKLIYWMNWCVVNKEISDEMGIKSRKLVQTKYERNFVQNKLLEEYKKLLGIK